MLTVTRRSTHAAHCWDLKMQSSQAAPRLGGRCILRHFAFLESINTTLLIQGAFRISAHASLAKSRSTCKSNHAHRQDERQGRQHPLSHASHPSCSPLLAEQSWEEVAVASNAWGSALAAKRLAQSGHLHRGESHPQKTIHKIQPEKNHPASTVDPRRKIITVPSFGAVSIGCHSIIGSPYDCQ